MEKMRSWLKDEKGFTLIEMALVLIIIGIILGAVVKGKNLIRSAEQKKVYTKFIGAWNLAYLGFYERTGLRLGDTYNTAGIAAGQDGQADTTNAVGGAVTDAGRTALVTSVAAGFYELTDVGLEAPTTNSANRWEYIYTDTNGGAHNVSVAFKFNVAGNYNYMFIGELPGELGIALDTMIDGQVGGNAGDFLAVDATDTTVGTWEAATTEGAARWRMQF